MNLARRQKVGYKIDIFNKINYNIMISRKGHF